MTAETPNYLEQFPSFDPTTLPAIPAEWRDQSWRNDMCPCWAVEFDDPGQTGLYVWVDFADPDQRDFPDAPRFCVTDACWEEGFQSDDWAEVLKVVETRRKRHHDPFFEKTTPKANEPGLRSWEAGMCRRFDMLLQRHGLPGMSADELWHELNALAYPPHASKHVSPEWLKKAGPEGLKRATQAVYDFWMEWDALEVQSRRDAEDPSVQVFGMTLEGRANEPRFLAMRDAVLKLIAADFPEFKSI